jgi:hypothetical protein
MTFVVAHIFGEEERDPRLENLRDLIAELDNADSEHTDVSLQHESGWAISAYASGLVTYENTEDEGEPRHMENVSREEMLALFRQVARAEFDSLEEKNWAPGYP